MSSSLCSDTVMPVECFKKVRRVAVSRAGWKQCGGASTSTVQSSSPSHPASNPGPAASSTTLPSARPPVNEMSILSTWAQVSFLNFGSHFLMYLWVPCRWDNGFPYFHLTVVYSTWSTSCGQALCYVLGTRWWSGKRQTRVTAEAGGTFGFKNGRKETLP